MSQGGMNNVGSQAGVVFSVMGANGVTASPTTGNVVVSGVNATTSSVGVASFNPADFTVNGSGQVSLISSASWTDQSGAFAAVAGGGYFITNTATATLPAAPSQGNTIAFAVDTTNLLTIQANTGQKIRIGTGTSTVTGTATSIKQGDSVTLVYRAADTTWISTQSIGNFTMA